MKFHASFRRPSLLAPALVALLVLVLATPALAAGSESKPSPKDQAETDYNQGIEQLKSGDLAAAQASFEKALQSKEDFAEAHNNLGYALRKLGEDHWAAAEDHYDRALELDPQLAEAYHYRGVLHVLKGDEESAKADHARLTELNPELADQLMEVLATGQEPEGHNGVTGSW